ncbi:MAG: protein kinase [Psychrobacter sp.]|nr:protein kinase [Psychrobacter sp.]
MKNSANNFLTKQALQTQATQLLPTLTATFADLNYKETTHQRISQQDTSFQGLTKAQHSQFGQVMIKWEVSANIYYALTSLGHEIKVLKTLHGSKAKAQTSITIAPQLLTDKSLIIKILNKSYQLTLLLMPYYPLAALARQLNASNHQLLTCQQKQHYIMQAAQLIADLHSQGWLHNDIKPSNLLIGSSLTNHNLDLTPNLSLTDFALAQRIDDFKNDSNPTGTPAYLAPERWQGHVPTQQSDIYAFGIMVYEILTRNRPFKVEKQSSELLTDWAVQHCQQPIAKLPSQYRDYQAIIDKALAKRMENRYQNMSDVISDLKFLPISSNNY